MNRVELYAERAVMVDVDLGSLDDMGKASILIYDIADKIQKDYPVCGDFIDSGVDVGKKSAKIFFSKIGAKEAFICEFEYKKDNCVDLRVGEYLIFSDDIAQMFNNKDTYGLKDFSEGDEIRVKGISKTLDNPTDCVCRYRLATYIIDDKPIKFTFTKDSLGEVVSNGLDESLREDWST